MAAPIDLYVFVERNVFDTDARWLDALALLALLEVPGLGLQVRTKTEPADRALELARKAREATRDSRSPVLLNGTTEEARALGYDGAHWPEALVPSSPPEPVEAHPPARPEPAKPLPVRPEPVEPPPVRPEPVEGRGTPSPSEPPTTQGRARDFLLGASVHSVEAATRAEAAGAHFVVAGTVFDAGSKPVAGEGVEKLRRIAEATRLPVLAIGGVRPDRMRACIEAGAAGVAVVTSVLRAPDMAAAVHELREALDEAHSVIGAARRETA